MNARGISDGKERLVVALRGFLGKRIVPGLLSGQLSGIGMTEAEVTNISEGVLAVVTGV